jgi:hypothetical protein
VRGFAALCAFGGVIIIGGAVIIQETTGSWPRVSPFEIVIGAGMAAGAVASSLVVAWSLKRAIKDARFVMASEAARWVAGGIMTTGLPSGVLDIVRKVFGRHPQM